MVWGAMPSAAGHPDERRDRGVQLGVVLRSAVTTAPRPRRSSIEALVAQVLVGAQHGVQVDVERGGELAGAGQAFADAELAARDGRAHLPGELREERLGRGGVDPQEHASAA